MKRPSIFGVAVASVAVVVCGAAYVVIGVMALVHPASWRGRVMARDRHADA